MRITNSMMTNNILLNLNKNRSVMQTFEEQMASGKRIQKPSDDPIVAARALKFRTNLNEITQYKTNTNDAISWLNVTEQSVDNVNTILKRVRELSVQSANGTLSTKNREGTISEMEQLRDQLINEGNVTYAGRYLFTGYQTNSSLAFEKNTTDDYEITESFSPESSEAIKKVYNGEIHDVTRIRLGYEGVKAGTVTLAQIPGFNLIEMDSISTTPLAYAPEPFDPALYDVADPTTYPKVHFLKDTGELIFNHEDITSAAVSIPATFDFTYGKNNFVQGDLKPDHYFTSTNLTTGATYAADNEPMKYQVSYSQNIQVNVMGYEFMKEDMIRDINEMIDKVKSIQFDGSIEDQLNQDLIGKDFSALLGKLDVHLSNNSNIQATIGGKINRLELTLDRLSEDKLNFTSLLSDNEDVDMAEVLIKFSAQEVVYKAALSSSAKVIQPTLLDFIG